MSMSFHGDFWKSLLEPNQATTNPSCCGVTGARTVLAHYLREYKVALPPGKCYVFGQPGEGGYQPWDAMAAPFPIFVIDSATKSNAFLLFEISSEELGLLAQKHHDGERSKTMAAAMGVRREQPFEKPPRSVLKKIMVARSQLRDMDSCAKPLEYSAKHKAFTLNRGYGAPNWEKSCSRVWSNLGGGADLAKRELRLELTQGLREWPRCRLHDCDVQVHYRPAIENLVSKAERSPFISAALGCPSCKFKNA